MLQSVGSQRVGRDGQLNGSNHMTYAVCFFPRYTYKHKDLYVVINAISGVITTGGV